MNSQWIQCEMTQEQVHRKIAAAFGMPIEHLKPASSLPSFRALNDEAIARAIAIRNENPEFWDAYLERVLGVT